MWKIFEFLIKMLIFALAFYVILDYIFYCKIGNNTGILSLIVIISLIIIFYIFIGKKKSEERANLHKKK